VRYLTGADERFQAGAFRYTTKSQRWAFCGTGIRRPVVTALTRSVIDEIIRIDPRLCNICFGFQRIYPRNLNRSAVVSKAQA